MKKNLLLAPFSTRISGASFLQCFLAMSLSLLSMEPLSAQYWTQKTAITGTTPGYRLGSYISLSADGMTMAVTDGGTVVIYQQVNNAWVQKGNALLFTGRVALSADGSTIAIGNPDASNSTGLVKVYKWINNTWTELGTGITGQAQSEYSGFSVSLSADGTVLAIGAPLNAGRVRVYTWLNGAWTQRGISINGEASEDFSGAAVSLSADGTVLAIGAPYNDGTTPTSNVGHVRIYKWLNNAWTQRGTDIDGQAGTFGRGQAVSLSADGTILAIGTPFNIAGTLGVKNRGFVSIYKWLNNAWTQQGADIAGTVADGKAGSVIALSPDGTTVAVGSEVLNYVRVYKWLNSAWTQQGIDITGVAPTDNFGNAIGLSTGGTIIAIASSNNNGNRGQVRTFEDGSVCVPPSVTALTSNVPCTAQNMLSLNAVVAGSIPLTYAWQGAGTFTGGTTSMPQVSQPEESTYTVSVANACGTTTSTLPVKFGKIFITGVTSNSPRCNDRVLNLSVTTTGGTPYYYSWSGPSAATFTNSNSANPTVSNAVTGTYSVTINHVSCGSVTGTVNAVVTYPTTPSLSISTSADYTIVAGTSVTFTATPAYTPTPAAGLTGNEVYQWKKNGINVGTNSTTYIDAGLVSGDIVSCVMTTNMPCASPSTFITSNNILTLVAPACVPPSILDIPNNSPICSGSKLQLNVNVSDMGTGPYTYQWTGASNNPALFNDPKIKNPTVNAAYVGTYTVNVTNACGTTTTSVEVDIIPELGTLAFTEGASFLYPYGASTYTAICPNSTSIRYSIQDGIGAQINSVSGEVNNVTATFTVVATATGCNASATSTIKIAKKIVPVLVSTSTAKVIVTFPGGIDNCMQPRPNGGDYAYSGIFNGKNMYTNGPYLRIVWTNNRWEIQGDDPNIQGVTWYTGYYNTANTAKPPASCWSSAAGCFPVALYSDVTYAIGSVGISLVTPNKSALGTGSFRVTFPSAVNTLTASNFTLTTSGVSGATVTSVTQESPTVWVVNVNTGTGDGTIVLNLTNLTGTSYLSCGTVSSPRLIVNNTTIPVTLDAGDIAFTGYNSTSTTADDFSFIVLKNDGLPAGTKIYFTNDGYGTAANALNPGEGLLLWQTTSAVPQFTQIRITTRSGGTCSASTGSVSAIQHNGVLAAIELSSNGDQIFALQGNTNTPTFIAGIQMNAENNQSGGGNSTLSAWDDLTGGTSPWNISANRSALPPSLTNGVDAVMVVGGSTAPHTEFDNAVYNCAGASNSNSVSALRAAINNRANWLRRNGTVYTTPPNCPFGVVTCNVPEITVADASANPICANTTLSLNVEASGTAPLTYAWTGTGTFSDPTSTNPSVTGAETGNYTVVVSNACGSTSSTVAVMVNAEVMPSLTYYEDSGTSNDDIICAGGTVVYTAFPTGTGYTYRFFLDNNDNDVYDAGDVEVQAPSTANTYSTTALTDGQEIAVTVYLSGGACQATTGSYPISVVDIPTINLGASPVVCLGAAGADLPFTITGSADVYAIDYNENAEIAGFTDIDIFTPELLPAGSSIALNIPSNVPEGVYNGVIQVRNNTTNCYSAPVPFTITISQLTAANTTADAAICEGTAKALTGTPAGGTWSIVGTATGSISGSTYNTGDVADDENVTIRYTIAASGACPATTDDVTFTVNAAPAAATNTTSNAAICEGAIKALTGTPAGGTFSIVGTATGSIPGFYYITGNVAANENVTIRYSIPASGACAATDNDVTFTVNANPGTADNTTSDADICEGSSKALTGTPAGGTWSIVGTATGSISGTTYNTGNVAADESVTIQYAIAANGACPATTEDVTFTVNANPGTADNTTSNAAICEGTDKALTGTPVGGAWSIVGMATGSISGATYSTGNVAANENVTIRYTVAANGACAATTEDVTFTVNANPGTADNTTSNAPICEGTNKALTGTPAGGTWSIVGMATGSISGATYSTGNVAANENVTIRYTIAANGACAATTEDLTFTVNANPGIADNTTANTAICEGANKTLTGTPAGGAWSIVGMATGSISGSSYITGDVAANENVTIRYTIAANGACAATTEDVTFTVNVNPGAADNTTSNTAICEGANKALTGTPAGGTFSIVGMATGSISGSTYHTGNVAANENVTIRYTIAASGTCPATTDDVTFTVNADPGAADNTTANAATCEGFNKALTGMPAGGSWSIVGMATGSISGATYSTGDVAADENVTVRYTIAANGACAATTEDVTFTVNANPGAADNTTSNAAICEGTDKALTGTPAGGTWSIVGMATGSISGATYSAGDVAANENVTIRYTVAANGACVATTDDVTFTVNSNVTAGTISGTTPLCIGATATYSSNGTAGGAWSSSNTAVATVNAASGLVTALSAGTTNITYTLNSGCGSPTSAFKTLTVNMIPMCAGNSVPANGQTGVAAAAGALSWDPVSNATHYLVYFGSNAPNYDNIFNGVNNGAATSKSYPALAPNTTYGYRIVPVNDCGQTTGCTVLTFSTCVPTFTCPANRNVNIDANCAIAIPDLVTGLAANPGCGVLSFTQNPTANTVLAATHNTTVSVTITPNDPAVSACQVILTPKDVTPPSVSCPGAQTLPIGNSVSCTASLGSVPATFADNCGAALTYQLSGATTGSGSGQISGITVNSGGTTITYTATDQAGLTSACSFTVTVAPCLNGKVIWEINRTSGVKDVTITVTGDQSTSAVTPANGEFSLALTGGSNFTIKPTKTLNKLNGVNASDVTRIQQHLSSNPITDPYKMIAADANSDGAISAIDASIIQQSILGSPAAQAQMVNSWRFVPVSHTLSTPPWGFPEQIVLTGSNGNQSNLNFYGIKVGDLVATYANPANAGQGSPFVLRATDQVLEAGATIAVELRADPQAALLALQFALHFDPQVMQLTKTEALGGLPLTADNFGAFDAQNGSLRLVWAQDKILALKQKTSVIRLTFNVLETGSRLSEVLQLDHQTLPGQVYHSLETASDVLLYFDPATSTGHPKTEAPAQLLQNRPNPFSSATTIAFVLPQACEARLRILDAAGKVVTERNKVYSPGRHEEHFDLDTAAGILYYELTTPFGVQSKRMIKAE